MKKDKFNDDEFDSEIYDDDFLTNKKYIKSFRAKQKTQARRKVDVYLEKKSFKEYLDDYDYDLNNDYPGLEMNDFMNDYTDNQDWVDYT